MKLYINETGRGKSLVFLHGWGFHGDVWDSLTDKLKQHFRILAVDLPGYGRSKHIPSPDNLNKLGEMIAKQIPDDASWAGWSLGGLIALNQAIRHPDKVNKLILIGSTPQFVQDTNWQHAIDPDVLTGFSQQLEQNFQTTVQHFLLLQTQGCVDAKEQIRNLQTQVFKYGNPDIDTLRQGLELLRNTNLRPFLTTMNRPTLIIGGDRDRLVSPKAINEYQTLLPDATAHIIMQAAHAPFLSHTDNVAAFITGFINE